MRTRKFSLSRANVRVDFMFNVATLFDAGTESNFVSTELLIIKLKYTSLTVKPISLFLRSILPHWLTYRLFSMNAVICCSSDI